MKQIISIITCSFFLFACSGNKNTEQVAIDYTTDNSITLTDDQYKNAGIQIGKIKRQNISSTAKANGKIVVSPQNLVSISAPLGGYIKSTELLEGMAIRKGDVLAVIEDVQYIQIQQDYLSAKAQFSLTESEYQRQKDLNQSKASSDKVLEQSKANYQTQQILIKSLEEKLKLIGINPQSLQTNNISKHISLRSPIDGYVTTINANVGKYINPSDVLFELVNLKDMYLSLMVFEKDLNKLTIGQKVFASTNTQPEKKFTCEIKYINKKISNQNATEVLCSISSPDKSLIPGTFMNAEIELTAHQAYALPSEAIVRYENKNYIFVSKSNNQFDMEEVQMGNTENGYTEILDSDKFQGQNIVVNGAYNVLMSIKNKSSE